MENTTRMGMNRTGMQMAPFEGPDQAQFALLHPADPPDGGVQSIAAARSTYIRESQRLGSVPIPGTGKGLLQATMGKMTGKSPEVLIDKLGQRLAYERSGVRLYQAMITKVDAAGFIRRDDLRADLIRICSEELDHFRMLTQVITDMGADPTAQTPGADVSGVASLGLLQVITDPRTTVAQSLEALLSVELTDHACWDLLIELAAKTGHDDLLEPFRAARAAEERHVSMVTQWLRETVMAEAG